MNDDSSIKKWMGYPSKTFQHWITAWKINTQCPYTLPTDFLRSSCFTLSPVHLVWKMLTGLPQSLGKATMTSPSFICTITRNWFFCTASSNPFIHTVSSDMFIFIHTVSSDVFIFIHTVSSDMFIFIHTVSSDMFIFIHTVSSDVFTCTANGDMFIRTVNNTCLYVQQTVHVYLYKQWQVCQYSKQWPISDMFIHTASSGMFIHSVNSNMFNRNMFNCVLGSNMFICTTVTCLSVQ